MTPYNQRKSKQMQRKEQLLKKSVKSRENIMYGFSAATQSNIYPIHQILPLAHITVAYQALTPGHTLCNLSNAVQCRGNWREQMRGTFFTLLAKMCIKRVDDNVH